METASRVRWAEFTSFCKAKQCRSTRNYSSFSLTNNYPFVLFTLRSSSRNNPTIVSLLTSPSSSVSGQVENDVLQEFLQDRQLNGDLITKYSDILFQRRGMSFTDEQTSKSVSSQATEETLADEPEGGFLKLTKTQEWLLGETSAPINRKPTNKEIQDTRERRRRLSLLSYEALKSELVFFTLAVGAACTGYCLLIFSAQAAVSYASGVGFSYLYLRLLYQYVDKLSRDSIPLIFRQRKPKKIGIRSEDLQDSFEKSVKGVGLALSSPRLVIPATIYGLWILLHRSFASDIFDFQIVPAMMGLFAYKAAALIQGFFDVAEELGFNVGLKHKKINISNPRVACEHEQFSRLRVTAATLSGLSSPPEFLENFGGLSDSRHFVSESAVIKGVKLVAEALARQIYGLDGKNTEIFAEGSSLAVNPSYITSWLNLMSRTPRVAPFLTKTDPIVNALRKELEEQTMEVKAQHENLDGLFTFYDSTKATMNIYQVASVTFDLLLLLVVGSYLVVLFSFLVITTRGLDDLISLFRRPPSRKVKVA